MKRKLLSVLLCLMLIGALVTGVSANNPGLPRIVDNAGLLSDAEIANLTQQAYQLRTEYDMDVVILTVNSLGSKSAQAYADDYYDDNGYGVGSNYSGVLLLLAMNTREWYISTCGNAIYAITDYGVQALFNEMSGYLSDGDYYYAFNAYLSALPDYFEAYQRGTPIDSYSQHNSNLSNTHEEIVHYRPGFRMDITYVLLAAGIGMVIGLIAIQIMKSGMKTNRRQSGAADYLRQDSYHLRTQRDMFLYSRVHKVPRPKDSGGHGGRGGGSSVHRSSGGRSHGGGGGRF